MLVKEIMTKDVKVATPETTLMAAAKLMKECDCGAIPVVKSESDRQAAGVITDRDIAIRAVAEGVDVTGAEVGEYMTASAVTVGPEDSLEECLETMEGEKIRRVIVADEKGNCIGIVTQAQIARHVPGSVAGELLQEISR